MSDYPQDPHFDPLKRMPDPALWREVWAHDPALLEWEGMYYVYSTDTPGALRGYQIRKSADLLHWEYVGPAFPLTGSEGLYRKGKAGAAQGGLQAAYDWCVTGKREAANGVCAREDGTLSLWAPHCVRGQDGKFWLYYCLTGYFGGSKSCIGLAKSDRPDGGFVSVGLFVQSPAGWTTPNAIDPQFFSAEGRSFLVYGSFGLGIHVIELDPATGLRKDGGSYEGYVRKKLSFSEYYGTPVARGSAEGGVVRYHEVSVLEKGKWKKRAYYYLMCSYGSLSSAYNMRCGRSERPEGPYTDVNGNPLVCSTDLGTGNKMLGSFRLENADPVCCPGHNDMFVTSRGVNLISYHRRTPPNGQNGSLHYLALSQYDFNSDGWPVMNLNRYAGETIRNVTAEELLGISAGRFEAVLFGQGYAAERSFRVTLRRDGTLAGGLTGKWELYGGRYVRIEAGEEYLGVVMPAWMENQRTHGLTVSAMGRHSGMALMLNSLSRP